MERTSIQIRKAALKKSQKFLSQVELEYTHLPQCLLFNGLSTRRHSIHLKMDAEQEGSYQYFCETYLAPKVAVVAMCAKVVPLMFVHSVPGHLVATAAHLVVKIGCSNKFVELGF